MKIWMRKYHRIYSDTAVSTSCLQPIDKGLTKGQMKSFGLIQKHVAVYETFVFPCKSYKIRYVAKTQIQLPDTKYLWNFNNRRKHLTRKGNVYRLHRQIPDLLITPLELLWWQTQHEQLHVYRLFCYRINLWEAWVSH